MKAAFATCFTAMSAQPVLPQGGPSGWAGMQDASMAPSCISLLLLGGRYRNTSAACGPTAEGSTFLPQPGKAAKGPLLTPAGLSS